MTGEEIIAIARTSFLSDDKDPQLWPPAELLTHLNRVYFEWCRDTECIYDSSTAAVCNIPLLADQPLYARDQRILAVQNARLESGDGYVYTKTRAYMDSYSLTWRDNDGGLPSYLITNYESGKFRISPYFNSEGYFSGTMVAVAGTKTFTLSGQSFSDYLEDGDEVDIAGTLNDGVFTIASATADSFTVDETVSTETVATVVRKVMDTLLLSVTRLPLVTLSSLTLTPEIQYDHQEFLADGVVREAYLKPDSSTFDSELSNVYKLRFEINKSRAREGQILLDGGDLILRAHPGTT